MNESVFDIFLKTIFVVIFNCIGITMSNTYALDPLINCEGLRRNDGGCIFWESCWPEPELDPPLLLVPELVLLLPVLVLPVCV